MHVYRASVTLFYFLTLSYSLEAPVSMKAMTERRDEEPILQEGEWLSLGLLHTSVCFNRYGPLELLIYILGDVSGY